MVVIDQISKMAHFIYVHKTNDAQHVTEIDKKFISHSRDICPNIL